MLLSRQGLLAAALLACGVRGSQASSATSDLPQSPALAPGAVLVHNSSELEHVLANESALEQITLAVSGSPYVLSRTIEPTRNLVIQAEVEGSVELGSRFYE